MGKNGKKSIKFRIRQILAKTEYVFLNHRIRFYAKNLYCRARKSFPLQVNKTAVALKMLKMRKVLKNFRFRAAFSYYQFAPKDEYQNV